MKQKIEKYKNNFNYNFYLKKKNKNNQIEVCKKFKKY